ncbi:hypothetical protein SAMN04489761_0848 [Tenacibaculum sp. MAR_2009_124]|nr:hypothetical protein SAMN04489761_0848 [Tenacibaculum sp. MAR_2009_124]
MNNSNLNDDQLQGIVEEQHYFDQFKYEGLTD